MTSPEQPRRRGRPTTPRLSQEKITRSALELIKLRGYTALTVAAPGRGGGLKGLAGHLPRHPRDRWSSSR